jgi:hypothetical protein
MESEIIDDEQSEEDTSEEQDYSDESDDELFDGVEEKFSTPQEIEETKKNFQRAWTKKTTELADERRQMEIEVERLKQKAELYDKLASDPEQAIEILSRMSGKSGKSHQQDLDEDDFSDYGDNAESMKRLVNSITNRVTKSITEQMSPIITGTQEANFEKEMKNLSSWVKSQREKTGLDLPDPSVFEPSIKDRMNRKGDTAIEAYKASINLDKLPTRKAVISGKNKKQGSFPPGSNKSNVKKIGLSTDDANRRRQEGKRGGFSIEELSKMYDNGEIS